MFLYATRLLNDFFNRYWCDFIMRLYNCIDETFATKPFEHPSFSVNT